jgi:hypothetical protein
MEHCNKLDDQQYVLKKTATAGTAVISRAKPGYTVLKDSKQTHKTMAGLHDPAPGHTQQLACTYQGIGGEAGGRAQ